MVIKYTTSSTHCRALCAKFSHRTVHWLVVQSLWVIKYTTRVVVYTVALCVLNPRTGLYISLSYSRYV